MGTRAGQRVGAGVAGPDQLSAPALGNAIGPTWRSPAWNAIGMTAPCRTQQATAVVERSMPVWSPGPVAVATVCLHDDSCRSRRIQHAGVDLGAVDGVAVHLVVLGAGGSVEAIGSIALASFDHVERGAYADPVHVETVEMPQPGGPVGLLDEDFVDDDVDAGPSGRGDGGPVGVEEAGADVTDSSGQHSAGDAE